MIRLILWAWASADAAPTPPEVPWAHLMPGDGDWVSAEWVHEFTTGD